MNCRITVATEVPVSDAEMVEAEARPNPCLTDSESLELENFLFQETLSMTLKTNSINIVFSHDI